MTDIKSLIKMIKWHKLILQKQGETPLLHVWVRYVWGDEEDEVEFFVGENEYSNKAPALFFEEVKIPNEVRDIVENVIRWRTWFKIEPVEDENMEATNRWKEVKKDGIHTEDEGVFEIDGKKYRVRKDNDLYLPEEDVQKLVEKKLWELSADAEVARKEDLWWEEEPLP